MVDEITPSELAIERIDGHDLSDFKCADFDLTDFLKSDAQDQMISKMNTTYVCLYNGDTVAYFTLSSDSIKINKDDQERIGLKYASYPALKIGRLAVDSNYTHRGIGSTIILWVVGLAFELCEQIGIRFISVDSYEESQQFYEKNFFVKLANCRRRNVPMYTDINYWD